MVRVAVIGVGLTGGLLIKMLLEKQANLVAAFTRKSNLGRDVGEVVGFGPIGVAIQPVDKTEEVFGKLKPDVCIVQTGGKIADNEEIFTRCASMGVNVLTLIEEAFFPFWERSEAARRLDEVFKKNKVTLLASGYQDGLLGHLVTTLMASAHNLREVNLEFEVDPDEYFSKVPDVKNTDMKPYIEPSGLNLDPEEYRAKIAAEEGKDPDGIMGHVVHWICAVTNLDITSVRKVMEPAIATKDSYVKSIDYHIPAGRMIGTFENVFYDTKQGIKFHMKAGMKVHENGVNEAIQRWHLVADPDIIVTMKPNPSLVATVAPCINRIPDVVAAQPGFLTTIQLGPPRYVTSFK